MKTEHEIKLRELEIKAFDAETKRLAVVSKAEIDMQGLDDKILSDAMRDPDISPGGNKTKTSTPKE